MPRDRFSDLKVHRPRHLRLRSRWWREWCFAKAMFIHYRIRLLLMLLIILGAATVFKVYEPHHSMARALWNSWSLTFGEPPEEFPDVLAIDLLFFVLPVLGLAVIVEGVVDFALVLRDRRRSERSWCRIMSIAYTDHIILVGCGRLGYRTYHLLRRLGEAIVIIEQDPANPFLEEIRRHGTPLFVGNARDESVLEEANIANARSIICATDDDLANLEVALDARRIAPNIRVVLRMFDQNMADKVGDGFNIHTAMSQSWISAPTFATAALEAGISNSFVVDDELVVMQRWIVRDGGPFCGRTVDEILREYNFGIVEHRTTAGGRSLFPGPDTSLEPGDRILIQGLFSRIAALVHNRPVTDETVA